LGIHGGAAREVGPIYEQFLAIAKASRLDTSPGETRFAELRRAILTGFSDRVGRRLGDRTARCALVGGRRGTIDKASVVDAPVFVAAEVREIGARKGEVETAVNLLTAVDASWLEEMFPGDVRSSVDVWMDSVTRRVRAERRTRFRDLVIDAAPAEPPPDRTAEVLAAEVMGGRMTLPLWDSKVTEWVLRVNLLARECPRLGIPAIGEEEEKTILEQLALGASGYKDLKDRPVLPAFRAWLSPLQTEAVDRHAPERVSLGNGKKPRVVYAQGEPPSISLRIQELFDVRAVPSIAMGRVTPVVKILAPNMRPVQVTTDLERFWTQHYPEIRPALARRYPKHEWR
jgi:ATP-dependent helicase HrpB